MSLHKCNRIYVIFHYLVSWLFKWKKKIFRKDLELVLVFKVHMFNKRLLYQSVFQNIPVNSVACPDISSLSLETCYIFLWFNFIISNPAIFLSIFNSMLITHHNTMACDLGSHTIAIKCCFGMPQPQVWCFL